MNAIQQRILNHQSSSARFGDIPMFDQTCLQQSALFFQLPIHIQYCNELEIGLISAMVSHSSRMAAAADVLLSARNRFTTVYHGTYVWRCDVGADGGDGSRCP